MNDFEDSMLDIAWKNLESENKRFKDIDAKAIGIITIIGILIAFLGTPKLTGYISTIFFISTSILFLITIFFSVKTISVREAEAISTKYLIDDLFDKEVGHQIRGIITTIAATEDDVSEVCDNKAEDLTYAVYFLGSSIILLTLYVLFSFIGI